MEASFRRAEEEERKFKEKQAKKEEAARAKAAASAVLGAKAAPAAPFKRTHKIIATRDKRAASKARQLAEAGEPEPEERLIVRREDGMSVDYATAVEDIQVFLRQHGSEATLDEVRRGVGIELQQPGLLEALRVNPKIEAVALATGERLKYRPPFGVRNRGSLAHMLASEARLSPMPRAECCCC